jgi:hypothetical protein
MTKPYAKPKKPVKSGIPNGLENKSVWAGFPSVKSSALLRTYGVL